MMGNHRALLWAFPLAFPLGLVSSLGATAWGINHQMTVLPINGPASVAAGTCPASLTAYETPRPRTPGSYARDGMIQLSAIATDITATQRDSFSAVWVGTLLPEYRECEASAGITTSDGERYGGHSYLRVQLTGGQAKVILDMTGMGDANEYTTTLLDQTMREGNPRWAWGGTD
ncbi:MAG: hypothetical protein AAF635_13930 [Cyanobacteria bacterium P01_C01_bin.69]